MKKIKITKKEFAKKEFARLWKLANNEIKEWIKFKRHLFEQYKKSTASKVKPNVQSKKNIKLSKNLSKNSSKDEKD